MPRAVHSPTPCGPPGGRCPQWRHPVAGRAPCRKSSLPSHARRRQTRPAGRPVARMEHRRRAIGKAQEATLALVCIAMGIGHRHAELTHQVRLGPGRAQENITIIGRRNYHIQVPATAPRSESGNRMFGDVRPHPVIDHGGDFLRQAGGQDAGRQGGHHPNNHPGGHGLLNLIAGGAPLPLPTATAVTDKTFHLSKLYVIA